jgi:cellulose synthase/poly-beta-1,6-N-acetylglucosamine synthase-like glycosyltransferase
MNNVFQVMHAAYVSIIIPTYKDWHRLALCVEALAKQTYPKANFEVIIINNDPGDSMPPAFVMPDGYRVITEAKSGSYAARNAGLGIAKGDIIGFTDSDCIPDPDWIKNAVSYLEGNKQCSRIAGKIDFYFKGAKPNNVELLEMLFSFDQRYYVKTYGMGVTGNMFSYKAVFQDVGDFNESLMSGGDLEWGRRAQAAGYNIHFVPDVIVKHPARSSFSELKSKARRIAGGHSLLASSGKKEYLKFFWKLIRSFKPNLRETLFIYKQKRIAIRSKTIIFLMRYRLQVIRALEKFKVNMGKNPERF